MLGEELPDRGAGLAARPALPVVVAAPVRRGRLAAVAAVRGVALGSGRGAGAVLRVLGSPRRVVAVVAVVPALRLLRPALVPALGGRALAGRLDRADDLVRLHGRALVLDDGPEHAALGRRHLDHDLVGLDVDEHLVALDGIALLLVPGDDQRVGDRLRQRGDLDLGAHRSRGSSRCGGRGRWGKGGALSAPRRSRRARAPAARAASAGRDARSCSRSPGRPRGRVRRTRRP